jgi:hypothetical protein
MAQTQTLIPDRCVAERYSVHRRTLARWDATPELGFPPPIYVRGRRYREVAALDEWDKENSRKAASTQGSRPASPNLGCCSLSSSRPTAR